MNYLSICKILAQWHLHVNLNESSIIDASLIRSLPAEFQCGVLPVIKIGFKCVRRLDILFIFFYRCKSKHQQNLFYVT
jgi:hypothetical protein